MRFFLGMIGAKMEADTLSLTSQRMECSVGIVSCTEGKETVVVLLVFLTVISKLGAYLW
jgi:hypothetical protein